MSPLSWFGRLDTWILILMAWGVGAIVVGLLISAMMQVEDRVARWRKERRHEETIQQKQD